MLIPHEQDTTPDPIPVDDQTDRLNFSQVTLIGGPLRGETLTVPDDQHTLVLRFGKARCTYHRIRPERFIYGTLLANAFNPDHDEAVRRRHGAGVRR